MFSEVICLLGSVVIVITVTKLSLQSPYANMRLGFIIRYAATWLAYLIGDIKKDIKGNILFLCRVLVMMRRRSIRGDVFRQNFHSQENINVELIKESNWN